MSSVYGPGECTRAMEDEAGTETEARSRVRTPGSCRLTQTPAALGSGRCPVSPTKFPLLHKLIEATSCDFQQTSSPYLGPGPAFLPTQVGSTCGGAAGGEERAG